MPARFDTSDPAYLRRRICERVTAGERISAMSREAGMPCHSTVNAWAARDPGFRAELETAKAVGTYRRLQAYDPVRGAEFLRRLRGGETIRSILRDREMPSRRTFAMWQHDPTFAEAVWVVKEHRLIAAPLRFRDRWRPVDRAVAEAIYVRLWKGERLRDILRSEPRFPGRTVLARWRRQDPEFDGMMRMVRRAWKAQRGREKLKLTPALQRRIVAQLIEGESLSRIGRRAEMPCAGTLYNWMRDRPEFRAEVRMASAFGAKVLEERIWETAQAARFQPGPDGLRAIGRLRRQAGAARRLAGPAAAPARREPPLAPP